MSRGTPLQIADLVAGLTLDVMKATDDPANGDLRGWGHEHMHQNYVLPNPNRKHPVSATVGYGSPLGGGTVPLLRSSDAY